MRLLNGLCKILSRFLLISASTPLCRYDVCGARYVVVSNLKALQMLLTRSDPTVLLQSRAVAGSPYRSWPCFCVPQVLS